MNFPGTHTNAAAGAIPWEGRQAVALVGRSRGWRGITGVKAR